MDESPAAPTNTEEAPVVSSETAPQSTPSSTPNRVGLAAYYGENGLDRNAVNELPDDYSAIKGLLNKYPTDLKALNNGIKGLNYLAGQKGFIKLGEGASEADIAYQQKMLKEFNNVPDQIDGYGIQKPEGLPDEYWDQEQTNALLSTLHKHNASPELVRELADLQSQALQKALTPNPEAEAALKESIRQEIRDTFKGETEEVIKLGTKGLAAVGIDMPESGDLADLEISRAQLLEAGRKITQMITEDTMSLVNREDQDIITSLEKEMHDIKNNPSHPLFADFDSGDPDRVANANKAWRELYNKKKNLKGKGW